TGFGRRHSNPIVKCRHAILQVSTPPTSIQERAILSLTVTATERWPWMRQASSSLSGPLGVAPKCRKRSLYQAEASGHFMSQSTGEKDRCLVGFYWPTRTARLDGWPGPKDRGCGARFIRLDSRSLQCWLSILTRRRHQEPGSSASLPAAQSSRE